MRAKQIVFKSNHGVKWTIFLVSWLSSILVLIIVATNNDLNTRYLDTIGYKPNFRLAENQLGVLSYIRYDSENNGRPIYAVYFRNLSTENNKLGIFKTGLHKVVKIRDLSLRFYQYSPPKVNSTGDLDNGRTSKTTSDDSIEPTRTALSDIFFFAEDTTADVRTLKGIIDPLVHPKDGWRINIDLSNVSEVCVSNFDCEILNDGKLFLSVQSKRASVSYKQLGLVLRGHVIISAANGSTLESNHIKWDIESQRFIVNGAYVLNRDGIKITGKNMCFDVQLNVLGDLQAKYERKRRDGCIAKL